MNIKNILIIISALVFGLSVVMISVGRVSQVRGQGEVGEEVRMEDTNTEGAEVTKNTEKEGVDYYLPYPGILPDHPLYWLKMIRDRVRLWLTNEPKAKFERLLLYADKRVGAARVLIEGGKKELGIATATKGEKYMERAVDQFRNLKEQEKATPELADRLKRSTLKHQEVLSGVLDKVSDQSRAALQKAIEKPKRGYEVLMQLMGWEEKKEDREIERIEESSTEGTEVTEGTEKKNAE